MLNLAIKPQETEKDDETRKHEKEEIIRILAKHSRKNGAIIAILEDLQSLFGYLPKEALQFVSKNTDYSMADIYSVATFYKHFRLKPRGTHFISICLGTSCHVRGAPSIAEELEKVLGMKVGETSDNMEFTVEGVNCLGACALGPVVVVDGIYYPLVNRADMPELIKAIIAGNNVESVVHDKRNFPISVICPRCNHSLMDESHKIDGLPSIGVAMSFRRKHGWFRFSSLYGSFNYESKFKLPLNANLHMFCPHCHSRLEGPLDCPVCSAPMILVLVKGGGTLQICSRRGCKNHQLDL